MKIYDRKDAELEHVPFHISVCIYFLLEKTIEILGWSNSKDDRPNLIFFIIVIILLTISQNIFLRKVLFKDVSRHDIIGKSKSITIFYAIVFTCFGLGVLFFRS